MRITEKNFITQLQRGNEKALEYVIDTYSGLIVSVVRKQLYHLPELQQEGINDVLLALWQQTLLSSPLTGPSLWTMAWMSH